MLSLYPFLFVLPVLIGLFLLQMIRRDRRRQFVRDRLLDITADAHETEPTPRLTLHRRVRRAASSVAVFQLHRKLRRRLDAALQAAGNRIGLLHLIVAALLAGLMVIAFADLVLSLNPALASLLGTLAAAVAAAVLLQLAQSRYRNRFLDVFPDALDLIRRAVKAGLPVNEALAVAGREIADPVGSELRRAVDQVQIGVQIIDALQETADRVRAADFRFFVVALALQGKTGGSLAETLANLSGVIRARKALRLKARALSSEAKASAAVLAALPFLVGAIMYVMNRDLARLLLLDPRGRFMTGVAFLSLVTGLTTMAVMIKRAQR